MKSQQRGKRDYMRTQIHDMQEEVMYQKDNPVFVDTPASMRKPVNTNISNEYKFG